MRESLLKESTDPNRYTAKAKFCFCKNNKRMIITLSISESLTHYKSRVRWREPRKLIQGAIGGAKSAGSRHAQGDAMSGGWVLDLLVLKKGTHACVRHVTGSRVLI